ncbi:hypothetical protein SELMODRAFT_438744 [Selaginella moellendorffii]|uniref:THO complex subunit 7 n=1 Tax=Selaginella moellendorffii TaxID=88036 RepID=D8QZ36_SELML|nr:THO complex subunit 7A [Selaginella moellendorffii]EFJ34721.1 hypothetical protein SELMODRAFT_438744 [Selaginella moellendorffii]|eukprot:XP_002964388.1 THO complex subunit 7A [Selaginella moellendorffii]
MATEPAGVRSGTKVKKVAGKREEVTGHFAFGPAEDDAIIRQRLLTRTTTTRGEPPLKKLLKKFVAFVAEVDKSSDNVVECEKLYKSLLQELSTFELPLLKTRAVIDANKREQQSFKDLQQQLDQQTIQTRNDIEDLKIQLEQSKIERQHKEECEAIRRLIAAQPPRSETQNVITELEKEIATLEAENMTATRTLELRKKQFALLLHAVDSLQTTLEDEQQSSAIEQDTSSSGAFVSMEAPVAAAEPMAVDPV